MLDMSRNDHLHSICMNERRGFIAHPFECPPICLAMECAVPEIHFYFLNFVGKSPLNFTALAEIHPLRWHACIIHPLNLSIQSPSLPFISLLHSLKPYHASKSLRPSSFAQGTTWVSCLLYIYTCSAFL